MQRKSHYSPFMQTNYFILLFLSWCRSSTDVTKVCHSKDLCRKIPSFCKTQIFIVFLVPIIKLTYLYYIVISSKNSWREKITLGYIKKLWVIDLNNISRITIKAKSRQQKQIMKFIYMYKMQGCSCACIPLKETSLLKIYSSSERFGFIL